MLKMKSEKNNQMLTDEIESLFRQNINIQPNKRWQRDERGVKKQMAAVSVGCGVMGWDPSYFFAVLPFSRQPSAFVARVTYTRWRAFLMASLLLRLRP